MIIALLVADAAVALWLALSFARAGKGQDGRGYNIFALIAGISATAFAFMAGRLS